MGASGSKVVSFTSWDSVGLYWQETSQDPTTNTTTISWQLKLIATSSGRIDSSAQKYWSVTINGTKYSGKNTIGISNNQTKTLASGTTKIKHNSDGTKTFSYSFLQDLYITFSGNVINAVSGSGTGTLTKIQRKTVMVVPSYTLDGTTPMTLSLSKGNSSFTHTITYTCGTATGTICTKSSSTSVSWTPPKSLASQNTTGTNLNVTYKVTTYNGSTSLGSNTYSKAMTISLFVFKPSCDPTVTDEDGHFAKYGFYVKGESRFKIAVGVGESYGSPAQSFAVQANGTRYNKASFTTDYLKTAGSQTISAMVMDKRGSKGYGYVAVAVIDYSAPNITELSVRRCNADGSENINGEHIQVTYGGTVAPLNNKNSISFAVSYKKTADSTYTALELDDVTEYSVSGATAIFAADTASSYDVKIELSDDINTTTKTTRASTGAALMHWGAEGKSVGIGKIAELENGLDIGFITRFNGGIAHPILEPATDFNDIRTPNTYIGANVSTYGYLNCPIESGTFCLEVVGMGESGQVRQRLMECKKGDARVYERIWYQNGWGVWVCVSDYKGTLLWSGVYYMSASQTATLAEPVSVQRSGIVLVFSEYVDGEAADQAFHTRFVPKYLVSAHNGKGHTFQLSSYDLAYFATKYLYISNNAITGHANNEAIGTGECGIKHTNNRFVLRYVIGV